MTRQLHLAGFLIASQLTHSHAQWKHPRNQTGFLTAEFYQDIARTLELGKFDYVFFADVLASPSRFGKGLPDSVARGIQGVASLDPAYVVATIAAVTQYIGLGVTRSTTYYAPYDIARTFATLDHLTKGRIAWNVVTSHATSEAQNFGYEEHVDHELRYERAEEYLELAYKLWGSWDDDALVVDKESGLFADPNKVRHINHVGQWYNSKGPLSVPRSPQDRPVIMQAGSSNRGKEFAARWAEVIFEIDPTSEGRKAYYDDVKGRMAKYGRDPDELKIFPSLIPFVGETESIAREKQAYHNELADPIDETVKAERLAELYALIDAQRLAFNRALVGRRLDVLFDRPGRRPGQIVGRSPYMQSVRAEGEASRIGAMTSVEIVGLGVNTLIGRIVAPASYAEAQIA